MSKTDKNTELEKRFDQYWDESENSTLDKEKSNTIYNSISEELNFKEKEHIIKTNYRQFLKYAAIFVITISVVSYFTFIKDFGNNVSSIDPKPSELIIAINQQSIILNDNSKIELFSNSKLTYPSIFEDSIREVHLEGSALFKITKDEKKPFLVNQGNLITKVLGTSFLIKEDSTSNITKIYLHTGKIEITNKTKTLSKILLPGDSLIYNKLTDKEVIVKNRYKKVIVIKAETAVNNRISITFENVKLKDAYDKIQNQTGIKIDYSNIGIDGELILSLDYKNKTIDRIINDLNSFSGFSYEIKNNVLFIKK
jgi:transmembrane sensor